MFLLKKSCHSFHSFLALKEYFVDNSYDEEISNNVIDAFVLVMNVSKNNSSDDIVVPIVEKDQPILDGYSDNKEKIITKAHKEIISSQPVYDNEEDKEE